MMQKIQCTKKKEELIKVGKYKLILKERWKFYLTGYLIGYFVPIIVYGIPSWQYLLPIRIMGIAGALVIGTSYYYGWKKMPLLEGVYRSLKYILFIIVLMLITGVFKQLILGISGFNIIPYIGLPISTR